MTAFMLGVLLSFASSFEDAPTPPPAPAPAHTTQPAPATAPAPTPADTVPPTNAAPSAVTPAPDEDLGDGLKVTGRTQNVMVASTGDTLLVMYTGRLTDGTVFDTNLRGSYTPFPVRLGQGGVIQGWERGLVGAKLGDKFTLHIPAKLAYGAAGSGPVPANADLIFDIEVVGHWRPYRP